MQGSGLGRFSFIPLSRYLAFVAVVVLGLGMLQLSHLVPLPFATWLCGSTGSLLSPGSLSDFMGKYGYLSLFVLMTAESASAPIPSEVVLPIAGALAFSGAITLPLALVVSTAAALTGALIDYYLAFFLGRRFVVAVMRTFRLDSKSLARAEGWFERSGQWTVFAARFVPVVRAVISLPAGLFKMGIKPFVLMTVAGCVIWNAVLLYAGFVTGNYLGSVCAGTSANVVVDGFSLVLSFAAAAYLAYYGLALRTGAGRGVSPASSGP